MLGYFEDLLRLWPILAGIVYLIYQVGQLRGQLEVRIEHLEDNVNTLFDMVNKGK